MERVCVLPLPPLGDVAPEWAAKRVLAHAANGAGDAVIAGVMGVSVSTVERIRRSSETPRIPRQGQGRQDQRWIFGGSEGRANLELLERCKESADDDDELLTEVYARWVQRDGRGSYSNLCRALRSRVLDYRRKRLTGRAHERDDVAATAWINDINTRFQPQQLLCVDESSADNRITNRRVGYSKRGRRARARNIFSHRGKRFSVVAPFDLEEGFLDCCIVEGGFTRASFLTALLTTVLPHMNPYPKPRSVLILDGASIHHNSEVLEAVHNVGGMVIFLEPYDPQHMPIEIGFRAMKDFLRKNRDLLNHLPLTEQLRAAVRSVSSRAGRNAFRESGYIVPDTNDDDDDDDE